MIEDTKGKVEGKGTHLHLCLAGTWFRSDQMPLHHLAPAGSGDGVSLSLSPEAGSSLMMGLFIWSPVHSNNFYIK